MLFKKSEHRTTHPYVAMTIGTLAMIGAFNVVRCGKRAVRCVCDKVGGVFNGSKTRGGCGSSSDE